MRLHSFLEYTHQADREHITEKMTDECSKRRARSTAQLMSFIVSCGTCCSTETTATYVIDRSMSTCRLLSVLVCQGLSTGLEIRLSQLDVPHNTHMHKHPVTGLPVKQSEHEGPEDLAGGKGANREGRGMQDLRDR